MSIEWRDWCRLCANSDGRGSRVFENSDQILSEKIFKYISISIETKDELPQTICEPCSQRVNSFDRYADQCLRVQSMFRAMIEQTDPSDTKVGLIREEFLQENELQKHEENDLDYKVDIELMAIDADPFIPSDSSGPIFKKTKSKTNRKRATKQKHATAKSRGRKLPRAAQKPKGENERERRTSTRLQGIAQMQREFVILTNTDVKVKEEFDEDEDEDEAGPPQPTSKKRGRAPKTLVGAAKRKAKVPRVVKQKAEETANSKEVVSEEEFNEDVKDDNIVNESDDNPNDNNNEMDNGNVEDNENDNDNYNEDESIKTEEDKDTNSQPSIFRWECHVCNQVFRNWNSLSVHCRQDHQVPAQVVCLCAKVLASRASIIKHRLKHTNAYKYRCDKCEKAFHRKSLYDLHILSHVPKEEQPFVCCKCARRFHCEALLRHHERVHLPREERLVYPCNVCSKKFSSRSNVSAHLKAVHFGERPFVCDQCGHSFTSKGILQEHLTIHSDETPFKCAQCKKSFKTKYRLKIHMDTHRETPYQCPVCPHQLSTRRTLRMHLLVHRDTKAYQCATCGKAFKRSKDLKNHHNLHTGRRPYTCTFCPRTFANGSNCRAHKRKMHPEELRIYEASLAAAENENLGGTEQSQIMNSTLVAQNPDHQVSNPVQQSDANSVLHNCPTPDHKPIVIHSNSVAPIPNTEFERHSIFESNGNVNSTMKTSSQVPHIPRSSSSSVEYPSGSPQEVNDVGRAAMVHMVQSSEGSSSMMGMSSALMARINENNGCRNLHQSSRNSQNLSSSIETDSGNRNMSAINLNASRRNMNSSSETMLSASHLASLTPLNLNVSEMHSSRHQHHLNESPTLSEIEESNYMAVSRRPIDNFTNSRSHIPNLNSNIQIHRQQQHQSLTSLSRSLVEREMSASSNLNRMHHGQHPGGSAELQGYTSLNHLYQHHGESMPSAVAAAIAHSGSMGVPAFPGNPYIHHNMGYNRGSTNM